MVKINKSVLKLKLLYLYEVNLLVWSKLGDNNIMFSYAAKKLYNVHSSGQLSFVYLFYFGQFSPNLCNSVYDVTYVTCVVFR